jgi:hypothetical protein
MHSSAAERAPEPVAGGARHQHSGGSILAARPRAALPNLWSK